MPYKGGEGDKGSRLERYESLIGALDDMPADWSENHDKYLRASAESRE